MNKGRIYIRSYGKEGVEPLDEEAFDLETDLQKLIADNLNLLGEKNLTTGKFHQWLLLTREKGIAVDSSAGSRWFLDHLLVDQDAIPTLVEVKRGDNPEVRRKVVGRGAKCWNTQRMPRVLGPRQNCAERSSEPVRNLEEMLKTNSRRS